MLNTRLDRTPSTQEIEGWMKEAVSDINRMPVTADDGVNFRLDNCPQVRGRVRQKSMKEELEFRLLQQFREH